MRILSGVGNVVAKGGSGQLYWAMFWEQRSVNSWRG